MPWRSVVAAALVAAVGYAAVALGTDGWSVWTAETARRQAVLSSPKPLPDYPLDDARGERLSLSRSSQPLRVVDLIYTRCPTVCLAMGAQLRLLQGELAAADLLDQVEILSITFDPANDDAAALGNYLRRFGAVEPDWRAARFSRDADLADALDQLGVIVIPEPRVGFVHNAAFYLLEDGHVAEIVEIDDRIGLFEAIQRRASS